MRIAIVTAALLLATVAHAQDREVPYWATIKAETLNMRAGPGRDFPVRWVYKRAGLPLKVVRVHEGWRLVTDPDGAEGWVTANLLSAERGALVIGQGLAAIRVEPADGAKLKWKAEPGVVAALGECERGWCEVDVGGRTGFVRANRLWGAGKP
jgi:SH3-like domain-containing protein